MLNRFFYVKKDELLGLAGDPGSDPVFKNQSQYLNMDTLYRTGETNQVIFFPYNFFYFLQICAI
jgi:hypothetical protein